MENNNNVYRKLQDARVELQNMKLKKTGHNSYSNFDYYELRDFLPSIMVLQQKYGLVSEFTMGRDDRGDRAVLKIINCDAQNESMSFESNIAEANVGQKKDGTGGAQPIQNLGAQITYLRRYLYQMAYEIVEDDTVDALPPVTSPGTSKTNETPKVEQSTTPAKNEVKMATPNQKSAIAKIITYTMGITALDDQDKFMSEFLGREFTDLESLTFAEGHKFMDKYGSKSRLNIEQFKTEEPKKPAPTVEEVAEKNESFDNLMNSVPF